MCNDAKEKINMRGIEINCLDDGMSVMGFLRPNRIGFCLMFVSVLILLFWNNVLLSSRRREEEQFPSEFC